MKRILDWQLEIRYREFTIEGQLQDLAAHQADFTPQLYAELVRCTKLNQAYEDGRSEEPALGFNPLTGSYGWRGYTLQTPRQGAATATVPFLVEAGMGGLREGDFVLLEGRWRLQNVIYNSDSRQGNALEDLRGIK